MMAGPICSFSWSMRPLLWHESETTVMVAALHAAPRDEVEVAGHDGLVLARAMAAAVRDERAVAAVVEEEDVPGRGAGHHVGERALDVGAGREHGGGAAVVVGEHGDGAGREAEAGDEGVAHGEDVVDAASQLVGRAGVVAADQGSKHLLRKTLHC